MTADRADAMRLEREIEETRRLIRIASRVVCFSGAGLSAESGVPTFRDAKSTSGALWAKFDPMTLASPEGFARDPALVIDWYNARRRAVAEAQPNPAHRALAAAGSLINVTQNVDDLLERAGASNVIHVHGSIAIDHCEHGCGCEERIDLREPPPLRPCPRCGGAARMRPGVVWFGETLPARPWQDAEQACVKCEVLLAVGTSAAVYPAAGLIALAQAAGAKVIIVNTARSDASALADIELTGPAGEIVPRLLA